MDACSIDFNSWKYRGLQSKVGLGVSSGVLNRYVMSYLENYGRYPKLSEIPGADSSAYLKEKLKAKESGDFSVVTKEDLLEYTGKRDLAEASAYINRQHDDLQVYLIDIGDKVMVKIGHIPTMYGDIVDPVDIDTRMSPIKNHQVLLKSLDKLRRLYGMDIVAMSGADIEADPELAPIAKSSANAKAFIYNSRIYINTDNASIDSPIHEMMHMFLGSIKHHPMYKGIYVSLMERVAQLPNIDELAVEYPLHSQSDMLEEILVEEYSKFLTGQVSVFSDLDVETKSEFLFDMIHTIDSILEGDYSVRSLQTNILNESLLSLAKKVQSGIVNNSTQQFIDGAKLSRAVKNVKSKLIEEGKLEQNCV